MLKQPLVTGRQYYFFPITIVLVAAYLMSYLLQKFKKIKMITHQRLWNVILLFSFLGSAFFAGDIASVSDKPWPYHIPAV